MNILQHFIVLFAFCATVHGWQSRIFLDKINPFYECPNKYHTFIQTFKIFQDKLGDAKKDLFVIHGNDLNLNMKQCHILRGHKGGATYLRHDYISENMEMFEQLSKYQNQIFIIFSGKDDPDMMKYLDLLLKPSMFVVLGFYDGATDEFLARVFHKSISNGIINIVAVVNSQKDVMFAKGKSIKDEECISRTQVVWRTVEEYDLDKLFRFLKPEYNGCQVNASTTIIPPNSMVDNETGLNVGFETEIIRVMGEAMNFNVNFIVIDELDKGRFTSEVKFGVLGDVYFGISEIAYSVVWPSVEKYQNFDLTQAIEHDCLTWISPHGRGKPSLTKYLTGYLTAAFRIRGWIIIFSTILAFMIVSGLNHMLFEKKVKFSHFMMISFFDSISMLVQKPVSELRYRRHNSKIVFAFWLFYSLVICSIYTAILSGILVNPEKQPEIDSLEALVSSDLHLGATYDIVSSVKMLESEESVFTEVKQRISVMEPMDRFIRLMTQGQANDLSLCLNKEAAYYIKHHAKGLPHYHILKDCFITYPIVIVFKKRSPLFSYAKVILSHVIEAGLVKHWKTNLNLNKKKSYPFYSESMERSKYIFYFYTAGIILSIIAFVSELVYFRMNKEKIKKSSFNKKQSHLEGFNTEFHHNIQFQRHTSKQY